MTPHGSDDWDDADADDNGLDALDFDTPVFDDDASGLDALDDYGILDTPDRPPGKGRGEARG
ncbi:hypothetical protein ABFW11_32590 [Mycolicibacterium porcinum]|uniref:hypothetical protein n=1 Tax=Mycolicibacterium porcinum TaxID=39693 RepID=UPI0034CFDAC3